jgi:predicted DNA-binding transcriptional regulator YafY
MRGEKPAELLKLARALTASAEGMTLDEMAEFSGVGRRTAERRRDAVEDVFGPLDRIDDGRLVRFRMNGRGLGSFATAPTSEELAELENAARACATARDTSRADILHSLLQKIRASLREAERLRLDTDIEARLRAEAFACQVGPRPYADPKILTTSPSRRADGEISLWRGWRCRAALAQSYSLWPALRAALLPRCQRQEQTRACSLSIGPHT